MGSKQNLLHYQFGIERYEQDGIIILESTRGDMSRAAVDEWIVARADVIAIGEERGQLYFLMDASHPRIRFSNYVRERLSEASNSFDGKAEVYIALLLPDNLLYNRATGFFRSSRTAKKNYHRRAFTNRDKAINWLRDHFV